MANNFDFEFLNKPEFDYKLLVIVFLIIAVAIYVGFLIYGNRGVNRLLDLQKNKAILQKQVTKMKKENVKLQKEYFELKDIEE
ncbi:MAG: phosphopyruvate hydratase [Epsilonproteobacteria bacterium]|nr:phosphopyruvate hydratase [Campylobacterota bacterium]